MDRHNYVFSAKTHSMKNVDSDLIIHHDDQHSQPSFSSGEDKSELNIHYDGSEYGMHKPVSFEFHPKEYGILKEYCHVKEIYAVSLSPTVICLDINNLTHKNVVRKTIYKEKLVCDFQKSFAYQECAIHSMMKHENVVELYDYTENEKEIVLLMEYCNRPTYFEEKIEEKLAPIGNERKLQSFAIDILEGISYVHSSGVIHCDMKMQNVLVNKSEDNYDLEFPELKLCDFGLSHIINPDTQTSLMKVKSGTHSYFAPESGNNAYITEKLDMWAIGIILYQMSVAYKPTQVQNYKYGSGPIPYRKFDWKKRSPLLQDLISKCLVIDPKERISSKEALDHPWIHEEVKSY